MTVNRVLVCGGRDFIDIPMIRSNLDYYYKLYGFETLIEGDCRGVDRIAGYWARQKRLTNLKFPANWEAYGKAAGYIRNKKMLDEGKPDLIIAFPGGKGTANMIQLANEAGVTVLQILENTDARNSTRS